MGATQKTVTRNSSAVGHSSEHGSVRQASTPLPDQRPEAVAQRQRQQAINSSPRMQQAVIHQRAITGSTRAGSIATTEPTDDLAAPVQKKENKTGLPDMLKTGVENLSGHSLDDVKVHYNSNKPEQLQAHAYAQGTDIHVAPGREQHLPHEAWHVVQQKQGRVWPTMQLKGQVAVNDSAALEKEADVMGAKAAQASGTLSTPALLMKSAAWAKTDMLETKAAPSTNAIVQRWVGAYQPGTLAYTTLAMRGLTPKQMEVMQDLHDDESEDYTIDEAREIAIGGVSGGGATASNPYDWDVTGIGNYATPDKGVQDVLNNFGHPTQSVVKTYDELASRVGYDVGKNRKGALTPGTVSDLHQMFDASAPLHLGINPFLNSAWQNNLDNYSGAKTGIPLYSVMRSGITREFRDEHLGNVSLDQVLKQVSGRPSEIHHLLFKALHPGLAANTGNLMLTERSERESQYGPGQHELMHMVASGNHSDKFRELLPQYTAEYKDWRKNKGI